MIELSIMDHGEAFNNTVRAALQQFEAETRQAVRLHILPWRGAWAELVKVALYNDGPHVSEIGNTWLSEFTSMNALRPFIGPDITHIGGMRHFLPAMWQSITPSGRLADATLVWAIPWLADLRLLYYRQDLLEQAGIDPATASVSPAALLQTCARLQAAGVASPIVLPSQRSRMTLHHVAGWVWGAGGDFVASDLKKVTFASAPANTGFYAYFDLARYLSPALRHLNEVESDEIFWKGQAAVTISGPWLRNPATISPEIARQVREVLPPGVPYVGGSHLVIWKHTRQTDAAVNLVRYLVSPAVQAWLVRESGHFPTRVDVLAQEPFASDPFYRTAHTGLTLGRAFPAFARWGLIESKLTETLAAIWSDILAVPDPDIHAIVDHHLDDVARRLNATLEYY